MTAAFNSVLGALRAVYEAEIERLADVYRPRILAGEFSERASNTGDVAFLGLERDLEKTHPWITGGERERLAVVACSRWLQAAGKACTNPKTGKTLSLGWDGDFADRLAAECMSHDVLAVAAKRGWVKPMRFIGDALPYALRNPPGRAA